jgi:hypothetical protein
MDLHTVRCILSRLLTQLSMCACLLWLGQQINTNVMLVNNTQRTIKAAMGPLPPTTTTSAADAAPVSPFKGTT